MAEFQNTIDLLGDEVVAAKFVDRTISGEFADNVLNSIGESAFHRCRQLTGVNLPSVTNIAQGAFFECTELTKAVITSITQIESNTFYGCTKFTTLVLSGATVCALISLNAFDNSPFKPFGSNLSGGTVYCPASLITQYQQATNWSTLYAAGTCNFVAIEGSEYE